MKRRKLSEQVGSKLAKEREEKSQYDGKGVTVSTGSPLLDLAISGVRFLSLGQICEPMRPY